MKDTVVPNTVESNPFGLKTVDPGVRVPEPTEIFETEEALQYIECDFPKTSDY